MGGTEGSGRSYIVMCMGHKTADHEASDEAEESLDALDIDELEGPSRSQRKRDSHELKDLGVLLVKLGTERLAALPLPERLREAVLEAKRLTSFGAQRRQALFIGKLMRRLDADTLGAVRAAVQVSRAQAQRETAELHRVERWRDELVADDAALERWLHEFPATDAQQLRALIRQARKDARSEERPGDAPRKGRAYRQIFALVRAALGAAAGGSVDQ
jgi:ribosome-associated protein